MKWRPQQNEIVDPFRRAPGRGGRTRAVASSDVDAVLPGKGLDARQQICHFFGYGSEQDCVVDPEVGVSDTIAHRGHRRPGNIGVGCF